ncbi:MAG: biopolymer transporter ExbD [Bacteroidota bacterium]
MTHHARATPTIPTASMADVAFLLLVFFLVATAIRSEIGIPAALPPTVSEPARVPATLLVLVGPDGALALDGDRADTEAVRQQVAAFASGGGTVLLRSHRAAPYGSYIAALDAVLLGHEDADAPPRLALSQAAE